MTTPDSGTTLVSTATMEIETEDMEGITAAFNRDAVDAHASGPDWLIERRQEAWAEYERLPLPTTKLEEWRYTDPKLLRWDTVSLARPVTGDVSLDVVRAAFGERDVAGHALQVNGGIASIELHPELRERGVVV
jgi:hypothetical protein